MRTAPTLALLLFAAAACGAPTAPEDMSSPDTTPPADMLADLPTPPEDQSPEVDATPDLPQDMAPDVPAQEDMPVDMVEDAAPDMPVEEDMAPDMPDEDMAADMQPDMPVVDMPPDMMMMEPAVPTNSAALFPWLQARTYDTFPAEPAVHPSSGPHGTVRTFVNRALEASIAAGNQSHPVGSAAIKELYRSGSLLGWAVEVKVTDTGNNDWYWYEVFSTTNGSNPVADGTNVPLCSGCHSGGTDFVLTPGPFQ